MKKRTTIAIALVIAVAVGLSLSLYFASTLSPTVNVDTEKNLATSVFNLINAERANASLPNLNNDTQLTISARLHSENMSALNYTSTTGPGLVYYKTRILNAGYNFTAAGENVVSWSPNGLWVIPVLGPMMTDDNSIAKTLVEMWMYNSCPCNKDNILGNFSDVGIGVSINGSSIYVTADFGSK